MTATIAHRLYNKLLRQRLPRKVSVRNGVAVPDKRLLDHHTIFPNFEAPSATALREHTHPSDHVVIIGGGYGVTAVIAARRAHHVTVYEGGVEQAELVDDTVALNNQDNVRVENYAVSRHGDVWGESGPVLDPRDLPDCDIMEIDAEGAELHILDGLEIRPRVLIVEYHPIYGTHADDVRPRLDNLGYDVQRDEVETEGKAGVITALRRGDA